MFYNIKAFSLTLLSFPLLTFIGLIMVSKSFNKITLPKDVAILTTNEFTYNRNILNDVIDISKKENKIVATTLNKINTTKKIIVQNLSPTVVQASQNEFCIPVVLNDMVDSSKDIIYKLETQNGNLTQSYKMIKKNGIWIFEPQWMIVETKGDSILFKNKDSLNHLLIIQ